MLKLPIIFKKLKIKKLKMSLVSIETLIEGAISGNLVSFPTDTVPALGLFLKKQI